MHDAPHPSLTEGVPARVGQSERVGRFAIDHAFEALLGRANRAWADLEADLVRAAPPPAHPLVVICYAPRTGSTMLAQRMAQSRAFGYVSNFMARFWEAPYLAGLIERQLGIREAAFAPALANQYGVTGAPHEPHEFGFFWNRHLVFEPETHRLDAAAMTPARTARLRDELAAMMSLADRPFFLKSDLVGLNPAFFARLLPDVRFVVLRRDPLFIAQSIYQARLDLYGDPAVYWSTRPSNRPHALATDPADQIALQIQGVYADIEEGLTRIEAPVMELRYESLCAHPAEAMAALVRFAGLDPAPGLHPAPDLGIDPNQSTRTEGNRRYLPDATLAALDASLHRWGVAA